MGILQYNLSKVDTIEGCVIAWKIWIWAFYGQKIIDNSKEFFGGNNSKLRVN